MRRLNPSQRHIVEYNHGIIFKVLGRHHLNIDKYYDIAAIALCEAAIKYDPRKEATFETFATLLILNAIRSDMRAEAALKRQTQKRVSLQQAEDVGSRENDPDLWAELGLFDEIAQEF